MCVCVCVRACEGAGRGRYGCSRRGRRLDRHLAWHGSIPQLPQLPAAANAGRTVPVTTRPRLPSPSTSSSDNRSRSGSISLLERFVATTAGMSLAHVMPGECRCARRSQVCCVGDTSIAQVCLFVAHASCKPRTPSAGQLDSRWQAYLLHLPACHTHLTHMRHTLSLVLARLFQPGSSLRHARVRLCREE